MQREATDVEPAQQAGQERHASLQHGRQTPAQPCAFPPTPPATPERMPPPRLPTDLDELLMFSPGAHATETRRQRTASFAARQQHQQHQHHAASTSTPSEDMYDSY
jgi:hypothetical protein